MPAFIDLYRLLGVSFGASDIDINKAFRRISISCHPDKLPAEKRADGEAKFKQVSAARDTLIDPKARAIYDACWRAEQKRGKGGDASSSQDFPRKHHSSWTSTGASHNQSRTYGHNYPTPDEAKMREWRRWCEQHRRDHATRVTKTRTCFQRYAGYDARTARENIQRRRFNERFARMAADWKEDGEMLAEERERWEKLRKATPKQ